MKEVVTKQRQAVEGEQVSRRQYSPLRRKTRQNNHVYHAIDASLFSMDY